MGKPPDRPIGPAEMDAIRQEAFDFSGIGLYRYLFDGTVLFMDRGAMRILGIEQLVAEPAALVGRNISDLIVYTGPRGYLRAHIREHGRLRNFEYPFRTLGGEDRWALHDSYLVRDAVTGEESIQVIIQDITARKRAELALAEERERLVVTLRSIGDGVITTDCEGRVTLLNRVGEALTGWKQEAALGRPLCEVFQIISEGTRAPCESPAEKVLRTGGTVGLVGRTLLVSRDGRERVVADSAAPIRDPGSKVIGVVLVFRDVTEKERMERDLQRIEKLDSIGLLAGGIAHDFNNLLSAILGNISLAQLYARPGDPVFPLLGHAEKATLRAKELTYQLLTFAKGGAPVKKPTGIEGIVRDAAAFAMSGSKNRCIFAFDSPLPAVDADAGQIGQVVHNLVLNADQAMPQGGEISIGGETFLAGRDESVALGPGLYVRVTIRDQGIGIPEEHLARVFDPYFTTKQKGSGLGLTVAHSIIKSHGGHISVTSRLGHGTSVQFYLPAAASAPEDMKEVEMPPREAGKGRVLVMDDEEGVRDVLVGMLVHLGYEVECAAHGAETVEKYFRARDAAAAFDLLILDLTIPGGMGGVETVRQLRSRGADVPIIASSGYSCDPALADPGAYGFAAAISKPFNIIDLHRVIEQVSRPGATGS